MEEQKPKRDWRKEVQLDTNELMRDMIDVFNKHYSKSINRVPLVELKSAITEHYILSIMQLFAHLFTGLAGCESEIESKFMNDMAHFFKSARMERIAAGEDIYTGPKEIK